MMFFTSILLLSARLTCSALNDEPQVVIFPAESVPESIPRGTYIAAGLPPVLELADYLDLHPDTPITRADVTVPDLDSNFGAVTCGGPELDESAAHGRARGRQGFYRAHSTHSRARSPFPRVPLVPAIPGRGRRGGRLQIIGPGEGFSVPAIFRLPKWGLQRPRRSLLGLVSRSPYAYSLPPACHCGTHRESRRSTRWLSPVDASPHDWFQRALYVTGRTESSLSWLPWLDAGFPLYHSWKYKRRNPARIRCDVPWRVV
ncbi:hypothetical protein DFH07DRAFT_818918 [Mycena maculata]|uniref:Uncharacterized protein n=1 Tax=Mycena maculata TaxID=230809 RepID=A0AAD7J834_9AGAR|nr:hypothetical protein DFH07DRAFT_818918 [Mycena maculata]